MKFNSLVPELSASDFNKSLWFYTKVLGFQIEFERPENQFAYLSFQGSQIMLHQKNDNWKTAEAEYPYGRGMNLRFLVNNLDELVSSLENNSYSLFEKSKESWYRQNNVLTGRKEFLVQDPDGYLLRFGQLLGEKPLT